MKLLIFSPKYKVENCGVGDHSIKLYEYLSQMNIQVDILTFSESVGEEHVNCVEKNVSKCISKIQLINPDKLLIQYTPNLWAQNGRSLDFDLFDFITKIKKQNIEVITFFHEVRYPIISDLRGFFFGPKQLYWSIRLAKLSNKLIFSCEEAKAQLRIFINSSNYIISPVGSNITVFHKSENKVFNKDVAIIIYGKKHPTKLESWNIEAISDLCENYPDFFYTVNLVGINSDVEYKKLKFDNLKINYCGYISENELSHMLALSDILLSPYLDGVGTRRGGIFSGMAHGLKVVSNIGKNIDFPWDEFLYLGEDKKTFIDCCEFALRDVAVNNFDKNDQAREFYNQNFSWSSNINKLVSFLDIVNE